MQVGEGGAGINSLAAGVASLLDGESTTESNVDSLLAGRGHGVLVEVLLVLGVTCSLGSGDSLEPVGDHPLALGLALR